MRRAPAWVLVAALAALLVLGLGPRRADALAEARAPAKQSWSFAGPFGSFDRAAVKRGFQVYREVCSACHSLKRIAFRNLTEIGFTVEEAKSIAAEYTVTDGPDDEGEMFERPARLSDHIPPPFANANAARAANNGALPPDLSLIVKARDRGPDYIYALLTGFEEPPEGVELAEGMNYNPYFPGHAIAMPPPLYDEAVEYADGTKATVPQMAHDVVTLLSWTAEPKLEIRKRIGLRVLIFLAVFTALLYVIKRKVWARLH